MFPFNRAGQTFDFRRFFMNIVTVDEDETIGVITGSERLNELIEVLHKKEFQKRTLGRVLWSITPTMNVGVKLYILYKETKKPFAVKLHAKDNKKLKMVTKWVCGETGK